MAALGPPNPGLSARRAWLLLGLGFAPYYLNDLAFIPLAADAPAWTVYTADYASRIVAVGLLLAVPGLARAARPPDTGPLIWYWIAPTVLALILLYEAVYYFLAGPLDRWAPGAVLFAYPRIEAGVLYYLDVSAGLLLVALSEELLARRVAARLLAAAGWGPGWIVILPALVFGLQHWSLGLGTILLATTAGMALMVAYLRSGSFALVVIAHYVLDLWIFV